MAVWPRWCGLGSLLLVVLWCCCWFIQPATAFKDNRFLSKNVSSLLDSLLASERYDKRIRPGFGGPPVLITVNMDIRSMGPVSETDETYVMDCYFRQTWYDRRLRYNFTGMDEFSMNWLFLEKVWKPDTYFVNGKKSYLHRITVPNKFLRIRKDGFLTYSMRLTIKASCPMHLRKFPLDSQTCPLEIGSYGYNTADVLYRWQEVGSVGLEAGVNLAQYDLVNITTVSRHTLSSRRDNFSTITVSFQMKRHTGYFMLQVFVPCGLIVSCSWVSFWIDPDAVPARVSLGVTTVLSMTTMGFGGRSQMPKVSYATALDWFVILCFSFVFAVMVEYAAINFIDKMTQDIKKVMEDKKKEAEKLKAKEGQDPSELTSPTSAMTEELESCEIVAVQMEIGENREDVDSDVEEEEEEEVPDDYLEEVPTESEPMGPRSEHQKRRDAADEGRQESRWTAMFVSPVRRWRDAIVNFHALPQMGDPKVLEPPPKFSKIDITARRGFPITFFVLIAIYSLLYMYYITDEFPSEIAKRKEKQML